MSEEESAVQESSLPTPGQLLKEAREAQGLSLEQVANKINLRAHNIEAIENDEDDSNLSTTFTKGYLKLYAKFVGVNESDVLDAYERINSVAKEPAKLQSFSRRVAKQTSDARLMMLTYFIIAIVIALAVLWWFQQTKETTVAQTQPTRPALSVVEQQASNTAASDTSSSNQSPVVQSDFAESDVIEQNSRDVIGLGNTVISQEGGVVSGEETDTTTDAIDRFTQGQTEDLNQVDSIETTDEGLFTEVTNNVEESSVDNSEALVELIFEFSDDCWMNLVDATGEPVAYGVKVAGYVMTVEGIPPFEVTLGAPQAVQISMAGEVVDMSRFPAGRTARFELPLQE